MNNPLMHDLRALIDEWRRYGDEWAEYGDEIEAQICFNHAEALEALLSAHEAQRGTYADKSGTYAAHEAATPAARTHYGGSCGTTPFYLMPGQGDPEYDQGHHVIVWYDDLYNLSLRASAEAATPAAKRPAYSAIPCSCGHDWGSHWAWMGSPQCRWCPCHEYRASAEAAPVERPEGWQPIETAPKDGQWLWFKRDVTSTLKEAMSAFKWDASHGMWYAGLGWWHQIPLAFTHWRLITDQPALPPSTERK